MTGPALPVDHPKRGLGCFNRSITAIYGNVHCFHRRGAPRSIRWHTFDQVYLLRAKAVVGRKRTEMLHGLPVSRDIGVIPLSPRRQPRLGQADDLETAAFNLAPDPEKTPPDGQPGWPVPTPSRLDILAPPAPALGACACAFPHTLPVISKLLIALVVLLNAHSSSLPHPGTAAPLRATSDGAITRLYWPVRASALHDSLLSGRCSSHLRPPSEETRTLGATTAIGR